MLSKLKKIYTREQFLPTFLSVFINPFYFLRKGLLLNIKKNKNYMKGILLDFGCGSKPYKDIFNVEKYIGLDIEKSGHNHTGEPIDFFYDGEKIPFKDNYFDSIFSSEVFEHIFNLEDILAELNRVLKLNGYILTTVPFAWDEHEIPYDFGRYTSFGLASLFIKYGFEVKTIEKSTNYVESAFQIWIAYIYQYLFPKNKYLQFFLTFFFITPLNLLGIILSFTLPKRYSFYNNIICIAEKINNLKK